MLDYFKSIINQDKNPVVICNLEHEIIYMNPAAIVNYEKWGGRKLLGKNLLLCHNEKSQSRIEEVIKWFNVRRHIVGGANCTLISVLLPPRLCRTGICRRLLAE